MAVIVNAQPVVNYLTGVSARQVPFAVSLGLRRTGADAQKAMQDHLKESFRLRRDSFNLRGIKINKGDQPTKTNWRVVITLDPRTDYLQKFEEGGIKQPVGGRKYLWIPNDKVFHGRIISASDPRRPKNLNMHRDSHGRVLGDQRTFMIMPKNRQDPIVLQRTGGSGHSGFTESSLKKLSLDNFGGFKGEHSKVERRTLTKRKVRQQDLAVVKLYTLKARVSVPVKLEFVDTITKTAQKVAPGRMTEAMIEALRTAR